MKLIAASLISGIVFGLGLCISEMVNPARVIGFLDVTGSWDPTLLIVMASALAVATPGFYFTLRRPKPVLDESFQVATRHDLDRKLLFGVALFGVGWGIAGFCPGPALASLATLRGDVLQFVIAMLIGMMLYEGLDAK